jgi:hypothetical protein
MRTEITASIKAAQAGPNDFGGPAFAPTIVATLNTVLGTGANQADILFADERQVNASSNDDLDLAGVLANAFGQTIAAAELVAILVINAPVAGSPNTTNLTIGGGTNPVVGFLGGTSPTIGPIRPGGFALLACGDAAGLGAVTAGTGDILRIANSSGATARYQIAIVARSVA